MSGFEVAGIVLGVLPLIVAAIENYEKAFIPFRRYSKYDSELKKLEGLLITQKSIYEGEAHFLLRNGLGQQLAHELITDPSHRYWSNESVDNQLNEYLGSSAEAVAIVIKSIETCLSRLGDEVQSLAVATKREVTEQASSSEKSSKRVIAKKLSFSFSQAKFDSNLNELSARNLEFQTLVNQIKRKGKQDRTISQRRLCNRTKVYDIKPYLLVQQESKLLYETLQESCSRHDHHKAHLNLVPQVDQGSSSKVRFDVCFRRPFFDRSSVGDPEQAFRLTVESCVEREDIEKEGAPAVSPRPNRDSSLKRTTSSDLKLAPLLTKPGKFAANESRHRCSNDSILTTALRKVKRKKKAVTFEDDIVQAVPITCAINPHLPGFFERMDLCNYIRTQVDILTTSPKVSIGCLQKQPHHQLSFFLNTPAQLTKAWKPLSLRSALEMVQTCRDARRLPDHERYRFARLLAAAALHFHGTPWEKQGTWRSSDIYLCDLPDDVDDSLPPLTFPYVDVYVRGRHAPPIRQSTDIDRPWIPNPLLFGLAILFIELALEQPLEKLQIASDLRNCSNKMDAEYRTATRLLPAVRGITNPSYERVVGYCLRNFGSGDNLSSSDLQKLYHENVICELLELEQHFAKFTLDD